QIVVVGYWHFPRVEYFDEVFMPSALINDLETFDVESLANWIDYVEKCILKRNVAAQYKQGTFSDIGTLRLSKTQAKALTKFLSLTSSEQRAVVATAKTLCRSMKKYSNRNTS